MKTNLRALEESTAIRQVARDYMISLLICKDLWESRDFCHGNVVEWLDLALPHSTRTRRNSQCKFLVLIQYTSTIESNKESTGDRYRINCLTRQQVSFSMLVHSEDGLLTTFHASGESSTPPAISSLGIFEGQTSTTWNTSAITDHFLVSWHTPYINCWNGWYSSNMFMNYLLCFWHEWCWKNQFDDNNSLNMSYWVSVIAMNDTNEKQQNFFGIQK